MKGFCMSFFNAFTGDRRGQWAAAIDNNGANEKNPRTCQDGVLFPMQFVPGCQCSGKTVHSKRPSQEDV